MTFFSQNPMRRFVGDAGPGLNRKPRRPQKWGDTGRGVGRAIGLVPDGPRVLRDEAQIASWKT